MKLVNSSHVAIAIWWSLPCKAVSGVIRELASFDNVSVDLFVLSGVSEERSALGWQFPHYGNAKVFFLPKDRIDADDFIEKFRYEEYDMHVLNSAYKWSVFNKVIDHLIRRNMRYGIMTEAPFNEFKGVKRLLKYIYIKTVLVIRGFRRSRNAAFVCSLSGEALNARNNLESMGFNSTRIYRFGYFSEYEVSNRHLPKKLEVPLLLLCVGYLTENKGQMQLVEALAILRKRVSLPIKCIITGYGPMGPKLLKYIEKNHLSELVTLTGTVDESVLRDFYNRADIFVAPAYEEPWGIRINEAIQAGVPIVMSDRIGACELLTASGGGILFKSGDILSLVESIQFLIENPNKIYQMQNNQLQYRDRINPRVAADYLFHIIQYVRGNSPEPGRPKWV